MKKPTILLLFIFSIFNYAFTQAPTQSIKGTVFDKDSRQALIGAEVFVVKSEPVIGTITDLDGNFLLENVPVGRVVIQVRYIGYETWQSDEINLNSAKTLTLNIPLLESAITTETVVVQAYQPGNKALNEAAVLSTRSFSVEETQRYAASANDPGRMAMGLPGVQPSRDSRSDIVIRGNSPIGLLWRLEGIDIPNPNHFARRGTSGGGITIFSISMLTNSDFSVGAFPAEYGNALSGVFDMRFRKGNANEREYTFRAGLLGLDFSTEGPIKKGKSSYLVNYRYSTLGILNKMGFHLIGERIDNNFQDLSFNLSFTGKNNKSYFNVWGIGGLSQEIGSTVKNVEDWKTFSDYTAYDFKTNMGALGASHTWLVDDKSYLRTTIALMGQQVVVQDDTLTVEGKRTLINKEDFINNQVTLSSFYNRKINPQLILKTGVFVHDKIYDLEHDSLSFQNFQHKNILDASGNTFLLQPYAQFRYRPHPDWMINVGLHAMFLTLNNTSSIEPRLGIRYNLSEKTNISVAYGLHSLMVPIGSYFTQIKNANGQIEQPNLDLDLIKTHHLVLAFDQIIGTNLKFHVEGYYQRLFNVPVVPDLSRTFSVLNTIQGYATEALVSEGTGTNKGVDISLEKFFNKGTFFILSGSIFNSTYEALDKSKTYNTQYNSRYSATFTGGREWRFKNGNALETSLKVLYNGGLPLTPLAADADLSDPVKAPLDEANPYSERVPYYFRPDLRLAFRKNGQKAAWWIALDVQNFIGRENVDGLNRSYDPDLKQWVYRIQSGLTPVLSFQIDF